MEETPYPEKVSTLASTNDGDDQSLSEHVGENVESSKINELSVNIGGPAPGQMSRNEIEESLSQIYDQLEEKRKNDMKLVEEVAKEIMAQAKMSCDLLEQNMLQMHQIKKKEIDDETKKLVDILDNIKQAETELQTSKDSLRKLCQEIQKSII